MKGAAKLSRRPNAFNTSFVVYHDCEPDKAIGVAWPMEMFGHLVANAASAEQPIMHNLPFAPGASELQKIGAIGLQVAKEPKCIVAHRFSRHVIGISPALPFAHRAKPSLLLSHCKPPVGGVPNSGRAN